MVQKPNRCLGAFEGAQMMIDRDPFGEGQRGCNARRHLGIDGSICRLYRQNSRMLQDFNTEDLGSSAFGLQRTVLGGHSVRLMTTSSKSGVSNDKDARARLAALRLYRILLRLCGSFVPTNEGIVLLQNNIAASDWGHYKFQENGIDGDITTKDQTEELLRLFLVLSGADPVSGASKLNDWYNDMTSLLPKKVEENTKNLTCWTTPANIKEAVRFAFHSSPLLPSQSPSELQALAVSAIQMMQDQLQLWSQSSISDTENGLVRVTATSRCLGTVSPVSIGVSYSPLTPKYRFAYRIRVENISSSTTVQLLGRYWHISEEQNESGSDESSNEPIEVDAPYTGAVGQLPVLKPGQVFYYVSGTDLTTPRGEMKGHFYMATVPPQTRSAKSGDDVTAVKYQGSKGSSSSSPEKDNAGNNNNKTTLFHAAVKPFQLESFEN